MPLVEAFLGERCGAVDGRVGGDRRDAGRVPAGGWGWPETYLIMSCRTALGSGNSFSMLLLATAESVR